jgi:cyclic-di-GMP-binding protein
VADQYSFDIVSEVDLQEVRNAYDQANREILTRFDFKGTGTSLSLDEDMIEIRSDTDSRLKAALEVLKEKCVRREIPLKSLSEGPILPAARGTVRQNVHINRGISDDKAREITKFVKTSGLKVQAQIQKDQVRISSKSKDALQGIMKAVRDHDFDIPLQFTNYRP